MRRPAHSRYTVFLIAAFAFLSAQAATESLNNIEVGRHYLDTLYAFDFPKLGNLLHADAVFEDPTSVVAFPGVPEQVFSVKIPAVTILRIQNGLVIHHADHVDYDLMLEQIAKQSKD